MVIEQKSISQRLELCVSVIPEVLRDGCRSDECMESCIADRLRRPSIRLAIQVVAALLRSVAIRDGTDRCRTVDLTLRFKLTVQKVCYRTLLQCSIDRA
jgi:hypothetical protein